MLNGFVINFSQYVIWSSVRNACGILDVLLRCLYRERILPEDLSLTVKALQTCRPAKFPGPITWDEVHWLLVTIDRRALVSQRGYTIVLLLVTYGLCAHEVAALTLNDIDWPQE